MLSQVSRAEHHRQCLEEQAQIQAGLVQQQTHLPTSLDGSSPIPKEVGHMQSPRKGSNAHVPPAATNGTTDLPLEEREGTEYIALMKGCYLLCVMSQTMLLCTRAVC